jgi:hypothetical protein
MLADRGGGVCISGILWLTGRIVGQKWQIWLNPKAVGRQLIRLAEIWPYSSIVWSKFDLKRSSLTTKATRWLAFSTTSLACMRVHALQINVELSHSHTTVRIAELKFTLTTMVELRNYGYGLTPSPTVLAILSWIIKFCMTSSLWNNWFSCLAAWQLIWPKNWPRLDVCS